MQDVTGQFLGWARQRSGPYEYHSCGECPFALFLKEHGMAVNPVVFVTFWVGEGHSIHGIPLALVEPLRESGDYETLVATIEESFA